MKFLYYLKYFYFIAKNWNIQLAAFTVYHEIRGEKKYHLDTVKVNNLQYDNIDSGNLLHASIYQASNYFLIEKAFEYLKTEKANYGLVDFGCGKGRVLVVAARYGFKSVTGVDFSHRLCVEAEANIAKIKYSFPEVTFNIICDDAANFKIEKDKNCFFFFNPFDEVVLLTVVKNLLSFLKENHQKVYVVYVNPVHKEVFLSAGFTEEYFFKKMEYLEFTILVKQRQEF